jgi:putative FmdB family regulatory protein
MVYAYQCVKCEHAFDVIKSVKDIDVTETCPRCGEFSERQFVPQRIHLSRTRVEHAEFNPGLGCVVKNKKHREELCREKGLIEIGNDFKSGDSINDHFDKAREEKLKKRWEDV